MRAPFQILAIPYKIVDDIPLFCVFHRTDYDQWQFIAGGGEGMETILECARREVYEESSVNCNNIFRLNAMSYVPADCISEKHRKNWHNDIYIIPEYVFAFECKEDILLSHEHTEYLWLNYEDAISKLKWDSNKIALYELNCRITVE
ncbi:MAG: NUDIX pyrophosphatase [Clostridia bacterium]|nr:NUDIX pyrophosphatase [Clostridia bacterium]